MRRRLAVATALGAVLVPATSARAADLVVDSPADDGPDVCAAAPGGGCTLRAALRRANADAAADRITFAGSLAPITITSTLEASAPVVIEDDGDQELRAGAGADPALRFTAGASGSELTGVRIVRGAPGVGVAVVGAFGVRILRSPVLGAGGRAIALVGGANGAIAAPGDLTLGPRRSDGLVTVSGTAGVAGTVEVYAADAGLVGSATVSAGAFSLAVGARPAATLRASLTGASGTSELSAPVTVPGDATAPSLRAAAITSTTQVRVEASEPIEPGSVQPADFVLSIAGQERTVTAVTVTGTSIVLTTAGGWRHGEAGTVALRASGAIADLAGNLSGAPVGVRVGAGPGDFASPVAGSLVIRPQRMCLARGRRCRRAGTLVSFVSDERGRATFVILRGNRRVGVRKYHVEPGRNRIRFDGRVRGKKLRAGAYRLLVYVEDAVDNQTEQPALRLFSVRRTTARSPAKKAPAPDARETPSLRPPVRALRRSAR